MDFSIEMNSPTLVRYADGTTDFFNPAYFPTMITLTNATQQPTHIKPVDSEFRLWCERNDIVMDNFRGMTGSRSTVSGRTSEAQKALDDQLKGPGYPR